MRSLALAFVFVAASLIARAASAQTQTPAHGYICNVAYFPEPSAAVGKHGSITIEVQQTPECNTANSTTLFVLSAGSNNSAKVPKLSEHALHTTLLLLQNASLHDKRVNIVYDAASRVVRWFNFFSR